jgi:hypothetical protein
VFARAIWVVVDGLSLTGGLRYSEEQKEAFLVNGSSLFTAYVSNVPY